MSTNTPSQHGSSCPLRACLSACSRPCSLIQCVHAWSMHSLIFPLYTTVASAWWSCVLPPLNGHFSGTFYLPRTFLPTESPLIFLRPLFDLFTVQSTATMAYEGVDDPTRTGKLHAPMVTHIWHQRRNSNKRITTSVARPPRPYCHSYHCINSCCPTFSPQTCASYSLHSFRCSSHGYYGR
jgi:hypothetical protein